MLSLWSNNCGSTWTASPWIITAVCKPRVTAWDFLLNVYSKAFSPIIVKRMFFPTCSALSTFTSLLAVIPLTRPLSAGSGAKGSHCFSVANNLKVSLYVMSLTSFSQLFVLLAWFIPDSSESMHGKIHLSTCWHGQQPDKFLKLIHSPPPSQSSLALYTPH